MGQLRRIARPTKRTQATDKIESSLGDFVFSDSFGPGLKTSYIMASGASRLLKLEDSEITQTILHAMGMEDEQEIDRFMSLKQAYVNHIETEYPSFKRYNHALKRLKEKKMYASTLGGLRKLMTGMGVGDEELKTEYDLNSLLVLSDIRTTDMKFHKHPISDDIWKQAIELAVFEHCPQAYCRPDYPLRPMFEDIVSTICLNAYYITLTECLWEENSILLESKDNYLKADEKEDEIAALRQQLKEANERASVAERKINDLQSKISAQRIEHNKQINKLQHDFDSALLEKEETLDFFIRQSSQMMGLEPEDEELPEFEDGSEEEDAEEFQYDLPEGGVLFLGGHQNMTKKLKQIHPRWRYQSDTNQFNNGGTSIKMVFMWTNHMSHSLYQAVCSFIPKKIPIMYVTATNLHRLEHEMKDAYNKKISEGALNVPEVAK